LCELALAFEFVVAVVAALLPARPGLLDGLLAWVASLVFASVYGLVAGVCAVLADAEP
jgi:hypothetical protein